MKFGKEETTKVIDAQGSTKTTSETYVDGTVVTPARRYYELKRRVSSQRDEHAILLEFSDDIMADRTKLDPIVKYQRSRQGDEHGYYYVILCYTQLEYRL